MQRAGMFTINLDVRIAGIEEIAQLLREMVALKRHKCGQPPIRLTGGSIVIIVKDNNPDVGYSIAGVTAEDAEGNPVPAVQLTYEVTTTDENVVGITPDPTDQTKGTAHFGAPGIATVNAQVKAPDGTVLGSFGQPFTVTTGDPAKIVGGAITFDGLVDTP